MPDQTTLKLLWHQNRACAACSLRAKCKGPVPAELAPNARVLFVGEAPGEKEDESGRPFQGKAGRQLNGLLRLAGLNREEVSVGNVVCCRPSSSNDTPKPEYVSTCAPLWIERAIESTQPEIVVAMGATAIRHFLGRADVTVEEVNGLPFYSEETGRPFTLFCTYHPAASLHDNNKLSATREAFSDLGRLLAGKLERPRDKHPRARYREIADPVRLLRLVEICQRVGEVALDFETKGDGSLYCWSFTPRAGHGYVVFPEENFASWLALSLLCEDPSIRKVFQNLIGVDYQVLLYELGIGLVNYTDTMIAGYLLQWEALGLKPIARRRLGMQMDDYADLIREAQEQWVWDRALAILSTADSWPLIAPSGGAG